MKKKIAVLSLIILSFCSFSAASVYADDNVKLSVNGEVLDLTGDQGVVIKDGRTMVPFRAVLEKMGAVVSWDAEKSICNAKYGDKEVSIGIGKKEVIVDNGAAIFESDVPALVMNGRTMVPLRIFAESLGAYVDWDKDTRMVTVELGVMENDGDSPSWLTYGTSTAMAFGKVEIAYDYPSIFDEYSGAAKLDKNIVTDASEAAIDAAMNYKGVNAQTEMTYEVVHNDDGIFEVDYYIEGIKILSTAYRISDGERI